MAASNATLIAVGQSGRTYTLDMYVPDAVATFLGINASGLAASTTPTTWRAPENLTIKDVSAIAAPTAVGAILQINNANANGGTLRWNNQLASLPNRMKINLPVRAGDFISFLQF
jgi:hypothetical protein